MNDAEPIRFNCNTCGKKIKVSAASAGKQGKCPYCKAPIKVPELDSKLTPGENESNWLDDLPPAEQSEPNTATQSAANPRLASCYQIIASDVWCAVAFSGVPFLWAAFLFFVVTGIDLFGSSDSSADTDKMTTAGMFYLVLGFTIILAPIGFFRFLRSKRLLTVGVETDYEIVKFGAARQGMQDVTLEYTVEQKSYKKKLSVNGEMVEDGFVLIVDPDKPKRVIVQPLD